MCASGRCPCAKTVVLWNDSRRHYLTLDATCNRYDCKFCGDTRRREKIDRASIGLILSKWQLTVVHSSKERESLTRRLNYQRLQYLAVAHQAPPGAEHDKVFFVYHQPMRSTTKYPVEMPTVSGKVAISQVRGLINSSSLLEVRFSRGFPMDLDEALRLSKPKEYRVAGVTRMSFQAVRQTVQELVGFCIQKNSPTPVFAIEPLFGRIMNRLIEKPLVEVMHTEDSFKNARERRMTWPPIYRVGKSRRKSIDPERRNLRLQ